MEAKDTTLNDSFCNDELTKANALIIPEYQRPYVWSKENVNRLLDNFFNPYSSVNLVGNIVLKKRDNYYEVIDGQQRLTTIMLISYYILLLLPKDLPQNCSSRHVALKEILYLNSFKENQTKRLILEDNSSQYDKLNKFYQYIDNGVKDEENIYITNYGTIKDYFDKDYKNEPIKILEAFINRLSTIKIIRTVIDENEDELEIFDVMNSTGVALSIENILKSKFLKNITKEALSEEWDDVFRSENDKFWNADQLNRFFSTYFKFLFCFNNKNKNDINSYKESDFKNDYYSFIDQLKDKEQEKLNEFSRLKKYAELYRILIENNNVSFNDIKSLGCELSKTETNNLRNLIFLFSKWGVLVLFPVVLYAVAEKKDINGLCNALLNITMYYLLHNKSSSSFNKQVINLLDTVNNNNINDIYKYFNYDISTVKEDIERKFNEKMSASNNKIKNIYMLLSLKAQQEEASDSISNLDWDLLNSKKISLEHIYPQTQGNWDKLPEGEEYLLSCMGNFFLLTGSVNSRIKNSLFSQKKEAYAKHSKMLPYWTCINKKEQWTDKEIKEMNELYKNDFIKFFVPKA